MSEKGVKMKKKMIFFLLLSVVASNIYANSVTSPASKITVPIQPPAKRVLRAMGYYTIFSMEKDRIYFDAGKEEGISKGAKIKILRQFLKRNPVTGRFFMVKIPIGEGEVISLGPDYSVARIQKVKTKIRIGDLVYVEKFRKPKTPFLERHRVTYSMVYTNYKNLTNYMWNHFGFLYSAFPFKIGLSLDYVKSRPYNTTTFFTGYSFKFITGFVGLTLTPIMGIAGNNVSWGWKTSFILGNTYSTHLKVGYMNIQNFGHRILMEATFKLTNFLLISSNTWLTNIPNGIPEDKFVSTLSLTGIVDPVVISIGGGFGGLSTQQAGPLFTVQLSTLINQ